ncbi:hypothetical protein QFZ79_000975 [Arthrobacter sp. V4I6]|uniref:hypothetical protein n=1 Tax=unclassified Arthrobacter TaxID=235627 RepID=UPI00277FF748|nr:MULTISPECIES: hypothetical protein [unclassified Arthrobacter]MDQ0823233.1 hypothetical protein [Arthrobacter sp. V1I7]MDQ0852864.1 hypothetical protein [Arthrobacter sp. V4I6]
MGIGDSISKAAENAMEDLGGTAEKSDDAHAPDPGNPRDDVQVHSSISEGSNALDGESSSSGAGAGAAAGSDSGSGSDSEPGTDPSRLTPGDPGGSPLDSPPPAPTEEPGGTPPLNDPHDIPGPGGLPGPDPEDLRADPSEGAEDPGAGSMGRG